MDNSERTLNKCFQPLTFALSLFSGRFKPLEDLVIGTDSEEQTQQVMAELSGEEHKSEQVQLGATHLGLRKSVSYRWTYNGLDPFGIS